MAEMTVAQLIAERLVSQGVRRIFGLCGGHIQPLWDAVALAGIEVVDVRHEAAAVYMAHATADLSGELSVALVTAGPGLTNAVTAMSNAFVARSPVLVISGRAPRPQTGMGAMQDIAQAEIVRPICRLVEQVSERHHVISRLDKTIAAALGAVTGATGPAYLDFPTDLLVETVHDADIPALAMEPREAAEPAPSQSAVARAAQLIRASSRIVVIGGRSVRAAADEVRTFLDAAHALYLDSGESRGAIRDDVPGFVPAVRGRAMSEADLVITLGRRLDFQLGYGSPAVFSPDVRFLRIGTSFEELGETRRGEVEVYGSTRAVLTALTEDGLTPEAPDLDWLTDMQKANAHRARKLQTKLQSPELDSDGRMSPNFVIGAVNDLLTDGSVAIADGGDILSFARVGLKPVDYLDCGALGCLGVGVPFAIAAALHRPDESVVAVIGDGSFGFTAMEIDTAVRRGARAVFVVVNNEAWNIERHDQADRFDGNLVGVDLPGCRYDQLARSLGAHGERVEDPGELGDALKRAIDNAPAVVDVLVSRQAKSPDYLSGLAEVPPRQAVGPWNAAEFKRYASQ
ncbi:thiamine pyrophosphate-binding protein [Mycolicibacterium austroafricanum]|uniref:acetolactate synthase n=1 Tax=Mycolicibacterium austroafricanum TaxID=39687 RepID=A0ABT8H8S3_MYCAO|nr:thiamine pyrophosphate-binding protein [Mycolicibacterium austroafricanum]MDN4517162.1 thiamine pyrophosphate-binding protein [Mycolicibacterium austroafricanum]